MGSNPRAGSIPASATVVLCRTASLEIAKPGDAETLPPTVCETTTLTPGTQRMAKIKIAQFGMGPIGGETIKLAATRPWTQIVGAVDIDPAKARQSLGELTGVAALGEARVYATFDELWQRVQPDVVLHTAGSKADLSLAQMEPIIRRGVSVASTCEELLYPRLRAAAAADQADRLARQHQARIVATGVNPGFVMDLLPICLTGVSRDVQAIRAQRVVDASTRRMPLQKKIGSGLDPSEFRRLFAEGKMGHAGFQESASLIAHALGWRIDQLLETCQPVIARHDIQTAYFHVPRGQTCGLHQRCTARVDGRQRIELDLKMYLDAEEPHDAVQIEGDPPLDLILRGGVAGDTATVAALVNIVPRLLQAAPGLRLITELAVPTWPGQT